MTLPDLAAEVTRHRQAKREAQARLDAAVLAEVVAAMVPVPGRAWEVVYPSSASLGMGDTLLTLQFTAGGWTCFAGDRHHRWFGGDGATMPTMREAIKDWRRSTRLRRSAAMRQARTLATMATRE